MAGVLCYSDDVGLAGEVAAAGAEVSRMLGPDAATTIELDSVSAGLRAGARVTLVTGSRQLEADADSAAAALAEVARLSGFKVLLIGENRFGTIVAAKVAARLRVGSLGRGRALRVQEGRLVVDRDVYGGKFVASVASRMPCVAMVQAGAYAPVVGPETTEEAAIDEVKVSIGDERRVVDLERKQTPRAALDIRSAQIVVSAGRGFAKKDDLALAQDLCDVLGAALGCSRPLSSDLGWLGEEQHIGLTGAYVHPTLYVAVGISGQLQHMAGVRDSKVIVAINKDKNAPIFQYSDYGVVGDLYKVVPALVRILHGP